MLTLEMMKSDWKTLLDFIEVSTQLKQHIYKTKEQGKQQVALSAKQIEDFLSVEIPPGLWMKLGGLLIEKLKEEEI